MSERGSGRGGVDVRGGFLTATAGLLVASVIALLIGFAAKGLQHSVDRPLYDRFDAAGETRLADVLTTVTKMGNERPTQVLAAVGAVVLAVWFARRGERWWVPLIAMPTAWIGARGFQLILTRVVDRDRVVLSLVDHEIGGYPSGGVARIVLISGLLVYLVVHYTDVSRRTSGMMFAGVAALGLVEAFARWRLNQHWFTDVVGGACFGTMLLGVAITTVRVFDPNLPRTRRNSAPADQPLRATSTHR